MWCQHVRIREGEGEPGALVISGRQKIFSMRRNASMEYAVVECLSVCHKLALNQNS